MFAQMTRQALDIEICCRCLVFLLRCHESAIITTYALVNEVSELQQVIVMPLPLPLISQYNV